MSKRRCKNWLQSFITYASVAEAPISAYFWVGVSTIAGALRRRVWIDQKFFTWSPNFYIMLVAPPGIVAKSTTSSIGMQLLREVPGIKFGPDAITWQALLRELAEATEDVEMPDGLWHPVSELTIESSELGNFFNPADREQVDTLISLWDGRRSYSKKTKTQGGETVENPWLNIIACTTPSWLAANVPESMIGGGFTSRCLFVYIEKKRQLTPYLHLAIPQNHEAQREALLADLIDISTLRGEYKLTDDAIKYGIRWYQEHHEAKHTELTSERFAGYIARKQTHIHKLALILSAAKRTDLIITAEDLQQASEFVTELEAEMPKVFNRIGQTEESRTNTELVATVRTEGKIRYENLFRILSRIFGNVHDFDEALKACHLAGHIRSYTDSKNHVWIEAVKVQTNEQQINGEAGHL